MLVEHKDGGGRPVEKPELEADNGFFQLATRVLKKISVGVEGVTTSREGISKPARAGPLQPLQLLVSFFLLIV